MTPVIRFFSFPYTFPDATQEEIILSEDGLLDKVNFRSTVETDTRSVQYVKVTVKDTLTTSIPSRYGHIGASVMVSVLLSTDCSRTNGATFWVLIRQWTRIRRNGLGAAGTLGNHSEDAGTYQS